MITKDHSHATVEARRLDVDGHEVPCGVHFFSITAGTDKNAELVGAQRFTAE